MPYMTIERGESLKPQDLLALSIFRATLNRCTLNRLVAEQQAESAARPRIQGDVGPILLSRFRASDALKSMYREALIFNLSAHSLLERVKSRSDFTGRAFQEIAYDYMNSTVLPNQVLLNPSRTLAFYTDLYSTNEVIAHCFDLDSLQGISVPDGLLVDASLDEPAVAAVVEYTTAKADDYFLKKCCHLQKVKIEKPDFFSDAKLIFVTPKYSPRRSQPDIQFLQTPFTRKQLKEFLDGIYAQFTPAGGLPTIIDVQDRISAQLARAVQHVLEGQATEEDSIYVLKNLRCLGKIDISVIEI